MRVVAIVLSVSVLIASAGYWVWHSDIPATLVGLALFSGRNPQREFDTMISGLERPGEADALWSSCLRLRKVAGQRRYFQSIDPEVEEPIRRLNPSHIFVSSNRVALSFDREFARGIVAQPRDGSPPPTTNQVRLADGLWYYDSVAERRYR
jgi:hypothetical protein